MKKVKVAEVFNSSIEGEAFEVEHLLAEPKRDHLSVDSVFCNGGMSSGSTTQGRDDDLRFEVFEDMWPEVDEVENFHETNGVSTACEDYLLDAECIEKAPGSDFTPCGLSSFENSSESPSEFGGTDNGDMGTSEMSTISVPVPRNGTFDNVHVNQAQAKNRIKFHSSNSHNTKHYKENDMRNTRGIKGKHSAGIKGKAKTFQASGDENLDTQKRLRKPTKRFIEEASDRRSKKLKGKQKCSTSLTDKNVSKGRTKRRASTSGEESEDESYTDESDDDYGTTIRPGNEDDRRKIPRMWALSEVVKLVDGISHHGVGRWTEIKRLLFPTSDYRTPIDLRDKWRNLLRASDSWLQSEGEDEQKQAAPHSRPLPRAILHRVSELASIYPYPKAGKSMQKRTPRVGKRGHRRYNVVL